MSDREEPQNRQSADLRQKSYTCPGEPYSITHSIHLARLAAFYSKCQHCEHRFDAEHIFPRESERHPVVEQRIVRTSLVTDDAVRGVYLNELDRNRAIAWGEAFAALLWNQHPLQGRTSSGDESTTAHEPPPEVANETPAISRSSGLTVVVAFDERPSSPDIVSGAVAGLRRMGCHVLDLGQSSLPIVSFHLQSVNANAGLYITGAGGDPSITGMEFLFADGIPLAPDDLREMESLTRTGVGRQTREIGKHTVAQGQSEYEASLIPSFHALRPLRIVCGSSTRLMSRVLDRLFSQLPCRLMQLSLPNRQRNLREPRDSDVQRVARSVVDGQHHLGLVFDDDGQQVAFVTDAGKLVSPMEIARLVIEIAQRENHASRFVVASSLLSDVSSWVEGREASAIDGGETTGQLVRTLMKHKASVAFATDGRIWFQDRHPQCDAILVMAAILQALSLSDASFTEVVTRINQPIKTPFGT